MKKLMLVASLLVVLSVSAQEHPQIEKTKKERNQKNRPTVDDELKHFDSYNLSSSQKQKVKYLLEEREKNFSKNEGYKDHKNEKVKGVKNSKNDDFDSKLEQILDKKQFSEYKQNREKKHQNKNQK